MNGSHKETQGNVVFNEYYYITEGICCSFIYLDQYSVNIYRHIKSLC